MTKPRPAAAAVPPAIFVWSVFAALLAGQLLYVGTYGVNCFYYDEWVDSVRRLCGA